MTHTSVYIRNVNPHVGLLMNGRGREKERHTNAEGGETTRRERNSEQRSETPVAERGSAVDVVTGQYIPNCNYTHTYALTPNFLTTS